MANQKKNEERSSSNENDAITHDIPTTLSSLKKETKKEFPQDIKEWFSTLSVEDRAGALGFEDKTILSLFSKAVTAVQQQPLSEGRPLSSATESASGTTDRPKYAATTGGQIVWKIRVSSTDFEKAARSMTELAVGNNDSTSSNADGGVALAIDPDSKQKIPESPIIITLGKANQDNNVLNHANRSSNGRSSGDHNESNENEDLDDIRIHGHNRDAKNTPETIATTVTENTTSHDNKTTGDKTPPSIKEQLALAESSNDTIANEIPPQLSEMFNNLCMIVPTAFQLATTDSTTLSNSSLPFITFHPTYLSQIDDDVLSVLDRMKIGGSNSSISSFSISQPSTQTSWIDAVRSMYKDSETGEGIPLYLLLILKFRYALFNAYRTAATNYVETKEHVVASPSHNTAIKGGSQIEIENVSSKNDNKPSDKSSKPPEAAAITQSNANAIVLTYPNKESTGQSDERKTSQSNIEDETENQKNVVALTLSSLVPKLMELVRRLPDSETSETLKSFTQHVPADLYGTFNSVDDMFFLPLSVLVHKVGTSSNEFETIIEAVGSGLSEAIERLTKLQKRVETPKGTQVGVKVDTPEDVDEKSEEKDARTEPGGVEEGSVQVEAPATEDVQDNGPGKKNKKKKKKKKRKGPPGGNQPANTKETGAQEKPNATASQPVDEKQPDNGPIQTEAMAASVAVAKVDNRTSGNETSTLPRPPVEEKANIETKSTGSESASDVGANEQTKKDEPKVVTTEDKDAGQRHDTPQEPKASEVDQGKEQADLSPNEAENDDAWETVEVKPRNNRKKPNERNSQGRFASLQSSNHSAGQHGQNGSKKSKMPRTSTSRKRNANRKMVKEILSGVLENVDDEVKKRRQPSREEVQRLAGSKWPPVPSTKNQAKGHGGAQRTNEDAKKSGGGTSMRDVLVGRQANNAPKSPQRSNIDRPPVKAGSGRFDFDSKRNPREKNNRASQLLGGKATPTADQNTAATIPETVSANSALLEATSPRRVPSRGTAVTKSESSSGGESAEEPKGKATATKETSEEVSPSPPLPTLLSPGNNNSASSSVASSLDAPHAVHHVNHHSSFLGNENDVGYHLLRVCDRLSRDVQIFMKRREYALEVRRRERGLVLDALQDSLSTIWPGMSYVEMYGSCATELDLPSSDLDIVVCGLDRPAESITNSRPKSGEPNMSTVSDESADQKKSNLQSADSSVGPGDIQQPLHSKRTSSHQSQVPIMYGQLSLNADRVVRLAMELEMQPWAVHVKAIPTASVPVIKILADPTRLNGAVRAENGEWLLPQTGGGQANPSDPSNGPEAPGGSFHGSQSPPPWRGADVVNGLMKVDITFEGPEHGGIGSTKFSSHVVQKFSEETKLPVEETPAVQVLMVLKEVLAQRRLNEPFSGGLSSYALLLLVISIVRERAIVKEELEKVERQRRIVAEGGGNSSLRVNNTEFVPHARGQQTQQNIPSESKPKKTSENSQSGDVPTSASPPKSQTDNLIQTAHSKSTESQKSRANKVQQNTRNTTKGSRQDGEKEQPASTSKKQTNGAKPSSWASIAKKSSSESADRSKTKQDTKQSVAEKKRFQQTKPKVSSFADAVTKGSQTTTSSSKQVKKSVTNDKKNGSKKVDANQPEPDASTDSRRQAPHEWAAPSSTQKTPAQSPSQAIPSPQRANASALNEAGANGSGTLFPQCFNDVTEVLCSGETTPGKLLMHFLLFYGQHFDSQSTAIDYSSTHKREGNNNGFSHMSPYLQRRSGGSYDPMTGMLTVDPIVVYDPLEGAESNNVARSCFAWSSIRWVFAQSYMTLSSVVEMSANNTSEHSGGKDGRTPATAKGVDGKAVSGPYIHDDSGIVVVDPSSSLLELLLAF